MKALEGVGQIEKYNKIILKEFKDIKPDDRESFITVTTYMLSQYFESECKSLVIQETNDYNKHLEYLVNELMDQLLEEKKAHNKTRELLNQDQQPETIELKGLENMRITITTEINLKPNEIVSIVNNIGKSKDKLTEKMKRLAVPIQNRDKVSHLYAGLNNNDENIGNIIKVNNKNKK